MARWPRDRHRSSVGDRRSPGILFDLGYIAERQGATTEAAADYAAARAINPQIDVLARRYGIVPGMAEIKPIP